MRYFQQSLVALLGSIGLLCQCHAVIDDENDSVYFQNNAGSQNSKYFRHLRGRFGTNEKLNGLGLQDGKSGDLFSSFDSPTLQLESAVRSEGSVTRVMLNCMDDETPLACKKRILDSTSEDCLRFIHCLQEANAFAVEVKASCLDDLDGFIDDPVREMLHIPDSLEIHHSRDLQAGQALPYGIDLVRAREAWTQFGVKGENVRVCVIDTGVWRGHEDLDRLFGHEGNDLVQPWFRDVDGHGTHCTGVISASDNNLGVVGVAPNVEIFVARVFSPNGEFHSSDMIAGLEACRDGGANVISMSLGGPFGSFQEQRTFDSLFENYGIVAVAAAGNTGRFQDIYPASYSNVISVAAVDRNRRRASFSTRNNRVDVAAPGVSVVSTWANNRYASLSGTSMACPHVAGVVALMLSYVPSATPAQIFDAITASAVNPNTAGVDSSLGHGIVDAVAAIEALANSSGGGGGEQPSPTDAPSPPPPDSESGGGGTSGDCIELTVTLRTDGFGSDTVHWLQSSTGDILFFRRNLGSFETFQESACLDPSGCFAYHIRDAFCDGIRGEGVEIRYGNELVFSGGNFGCGGFILLGDGCT
ncbi:cold-active serine alkaline protease [Nitzschia inconspicua]|uniref:Cold-active serine alkaline protease n=1 Tax=Nitzschia inconspicua TaxID=303405 RepID=A0A9K3LPI7_9STRA|nr:cold-active serine alkaline protease [Nitzschia inconspicua]